MAAGEASLVDCIIISTANVHATNDRGWLTTHTPFKSRLGASLRLTALVHGSKALAMSP